MAGQPTRTATMQPDGVERLRQDIEANLQSGRWSAGMRIATERALSDSYGIPRTQVRRVLDLFERDGRISRTVGRGTFVSDGHEEDALAKQDFNSVSPEDLMEVRLLIEPQLAELLVKRMTLAELAKLREIVETARDETSMKRFEELDHRFHMALTLAARNSYLTGMLTHVQSVRQSPAWSGIRRQGLTRDRQTLYQSQHEAILEALDARNADAAQTAIRTHLLTVRQNLGL